MKTLQNAQQHELASQSASEWANTRATKSVCSNSYVEHPSEQSPVVNALSLIRLELYGANSLFLSVILPVSVLLNLP